MNGLLEKNSVFENAVTQHSEIIWTDEYDAFNLYEMNRDIDKNYVVNKIKKSLLEQGWLPDFPMLVDEDFNIIDGQHRFIAAKELGIKIPVKISKAFTDQQMIVINNATKRWTDKDFIAYRAKKGDVSARKLTTLCNRYNLTVRAAMRAASLYTKCSIREAVLPDFDFNKAEKIVEQILEICEVIKEKSGRLMESLSTFVKHPDYDHERMLNKLSNQLDRFHKCNTVGAYLELFENIYNYQSKNRIRVRG